MVIVSNWKEERKCTYIDLPVHRVTSNDQTAQGEKGGWDPAVQRCEICWKDLTDWRKGLEMMREETGR